MSHISRLVFRPHSLDSEIRPSPFGLRNLLLTPAPHSCQINKGLDSRRSPEDQALPHGVDNLNLNNDNYSHYHEQGEALEKGLNYDTTNHMILNIINEDASGER